MAAGLAELGDAIDPSDWSGVLILKTPARATAGYIRFVLKPVILERTNR
jgi:hypothetical protein